MGLPRTLYRLFSSFQTNITNFTTIKCEKCPSSIRCWDSNPRPLEHKSLPITTRTGLLPKFGSVFDPCSNIFVSIIFRTYFLRHFLTLRQQLRQTGFMTRVSIKIKKAKTKKKKFHVPYLPKVPMKPFKKYKKYFFVKISFVIDSSVTSSHLRISIKFLVKKPQKLEKHFQVENLIKIQPI